LKRWEKNLSYIGGNGASGAMSDTYCISLVSVESVNQRANIQYQLYPMLHASMYMRASVNASRAVTRLGYQISFERIRLSVRLYDTSSISRVRSLVVRTMFRTMCLQGYQRVFRTKERSACLQSTEPSA